MTLQVMKNGISFIDSHFTDQFIAAHFSHRCTLLHFLLKGIAASVRICFRFIFFNYKTLIPDFQSLLVFILVESIHMYFLQQS